jgi:hypothetical protein
VEFLSLTKIDPDKKEAPVNLTYEIETQIPI